MNIVGRGSESEIVEVISEGKIMKVPLEYARRENLLILRKVKVEEEKKVKKNEELRLSFDDFRRPLNWKQSQVYSELVDNWQWVILRRRRELGMTRRQLAAKIGESENVIKLVENGTLPKEDFVIINKIQQVLGINLRSDKKDFQQSVRSLVEDNKDKKRDSLIGSEIKIIEDNE